MSYDLWPSFPVDPSRVAGICTATSLESLLITQKGISPALLPQHPGSLTVHQPQSLAVSTVSMQGPDLNPNSRFLLDP